MAKATYADGTLTVPAGRLRAGRAPSSPASPPWRRSGALDGALLSSRQFYGTDYTKPLLFIADGTYLANLAQAQHLSGDQWGMMNETGNYPGQAWLWLYTLWYQVPPMNSSSSGDLQVWAIMMLLTLGLALLPFIPGLRSIPRWTRVYRLIWRQHYRDLAAERGCPRERHRPRTRRRRRPRRSRPVVATASLPDGRHRRRPTHQPACGRL